MRKNDTVRNPLLEAIREIQKNTIDKSTPENVLKIESAKKHVDNLVDIITFCNDSKYLNLPNSNFFLRPSQTVILKSFYLGTKGNEDLKLNKEDWKWLYDHQEGIEDDGEKYDTNLKSVIKKLKDKEKEGASNFKELLLVLGRRSGKCRSEDDRISTTEGSLTFRELCDRLKLGERIGICTYDPNTLKRSVTYEVKAQDNGEVDCFEVETKRGTKETSSWNHPYLIWRDDWTEPRFIKVMDLLPGDKIAVADCTELFGKGKIGVNKAALLGHFQGDGGITHQVRYTSACPVMLNDFKKNIKNEFPEYKVAYVGEQYDYTVVKASGRNAQNGSQKNDVEEWLKEIGCFGKKSIIKEVPDCIYKGSKEEVTAFLSRLFGCDGYVIVGKKIAKNHGGVPSSYIGYSSSSRKLIDGVRHLLLKYGIQSTIAPKTTKYNGKTFYSWTLIISRKEDIRNFEQQINVFSKEEKVRKAVIASELRSNTKSEFDSIPVGVWNYVNKIMQDRRLLGSDLVGRGEENRYSRLRRQYSPGKNKIFSYGLNVNDKILMQTGRSDVKWDKVKLIAPVGKIKTVDLEVKGTHIIGGDILSHNTILASIITAYEVYKLLVLGNGDPHKYYNLPYDDEIAIINVALSQEQAGRLFGQISARLRNSPFFEGRIAKETTREIRLFTNADLKKKSKATTLSVPGSILILCGHSNPDTLTGYNTILLLFDELAFYDDSGKVTGTYFYNRLKPSLTHFIKYGDARTVEISSPYVRSGVFFDRFEDSEKYGDILSFQLPTWVTNPEVQYDSSDLKRERDRNPEMFATEYGAQWLKSGVYGNYFEKELVDRCVSAGIREGIQPHTKPIPGFTYHLHVDPAKNGNRYVAVLVAKNEYKNHLGQKRNRFRLANIWVWEPVPGFGINFHQTDKDMLQICYRFHPATITYDQWNSNHSLETLRGCGFNCRQTAFNRGYKQKIYQNLTELMGYDMDPEIWIYDDGKWSSSLISEMKSLKKKPTMRGISLMVDKQGESKYDDLIDCLAGACAMGAGTSTYRLPMPVTVRTGFN